MDLRCEGSIIASGFILFGVLVDRAEKSCQPPIPRHAKYAVVCNHVSIVDGFVTNKCVRGMHASFVSKREIANVPFLGSLMKGCQFVFVNRKNTNSRSDTKESLRVRAANESGLWPKIVLFPEGTTTNNTAVIKMQKGVFDIGFPIQAMSLRYPRPHWLCGGLAMMAMIRLTRHKDDLFLSGAPPPTRNQFVTPTPNSPSMSRLTHRSQFVFSLICCKSPVL